MRLIVSVLACVSVAGISVALADPPAAATPGASSAAASQSASPAAPTAPPAAPAASAAAAIPAVTVNADADRKEKHLLSEGYKIEMHSGEKYFCHTEEELGTHLGRIKQCGTLQEVMARESQSKELTQRYQQQQTGTSNH